MSRSKKLSLNRILLKISGESFGTEEPFCLSHIDSIIAEMVEIYHAGVDFGVVMGGGNILRGSALEKRGIPRNIGDEMGMLATVINALLLSELLKSQKIKVAIITPRMIEGIGESYQPQRCLDYLENHTVLLFAGGTGHPYFTTDTAAALRAVEIQAQCLFKGTKVDGVYANYTSDECRGCLLDVLTYQQVLAEQYKIMDLTAIALCMENRLPIRIFNLIQPGNLLRAIKGEVGTLVTHESTK